MKPTHVLAAVGSSMLLAGCASSNATPSLHVSRDEYGNEWPFTVHEGELACHPEAGGSGVTFEANGVVYAVNGLALSWADEFGWSDDLDSIVSGDTSALFDRGLELCDRGTGG